MDFQNYNFEAKYMEGHEEARLVVMVKKNITFERIKKFDKPNS